MEREDNSIESKFIQVKVGGMWENVPVSSLSQEELELLMDKGDVHEEHGEGGAHHTRQFKKGRLARG
jgi:hypothetical protein